MLTTIGLEIHSELKTRTKMFCDCLNDSDEHHPNVNICPICAGHPGTLPTINKQAVEYVLKVGLAVGGKIFPFKRSKFDRKNYFYPDLPKGYQISQYDEPLVLGGELLGVRVRRIHLEEDAGRLVHTKEASLVDFNRAGVPLMELVTESDIASAEQAVKFAKELKIILRYLDVSDVDMEKGHLRLEANISISPDSSKLGTKVEVKNINSFKALEEAINYEINRQKKVLESGKKIIQETRGWNDLKKITFSQRSKEEAQDYRYFPEPDLPPLDGKAFDLEKIKRDLPELPSAKIKRFISEYQLNNQQAEVLIEEPAVADYFEKVASELDKKEFLPLFYNYFTSDFWGLLKKEGIDLNNLSTAGISPASFAHLIELVGQKEITSRIAKDLLVEMRRAGLDPHEIISNKEWARVSSEDMLKPLAEKIIAANPQVVADYQNGKIQAIQFLIGKAMSEMGGKADPNELRIIFESILLQPRK